MGRVCQGKQSEPASPAFTFYTALAPHCNQPKPRGLDQLFHAMPVGRWHCTTSAHHTAREQYLSQSLRKDNPNHRVMWDVSHHITVLFSFLASQHLWSLCFPYLQETGRPKAVWSWKGQTAEGDRIITAPCDYFLPFTSVLRKYWNNQWCMLTRVGYRVVKTETE